METRITLQPAYVLHTRPFQNTSLLVDLFTYDYGRVTAVARGARREKSRYRPLLQCFHPLLVSFSGRGEVKTIGAIEPSHAAISLQGERLFSGLYLNELLVRLLHNHEEHTGLYRRYQDTLLALGGGSELEICLRKFELELLAELGYAINLEQDSSNQRAISAAEYYRFSPEAGFELSETPTPGTAAPQVFYGAHLIALRDLELGDPAAASAAKRLMRLAFNSHLGDRPLSSRGLFTDLT